MERLIDANRLWLAMASDQTVDQYCYPCAERIGKAIKEQPTVELRKHGHWKHDSEGFSYCSECGNRHVWDYNFCPDCGARMVEE